MIRALRPYAKAVAPFVASLVAAGVQVALTGEYDAAEIHTNVMGLVAALLVYAVPNR